MSILLLVFGFVKKIPAWVWLAILLVVLALYGVHRVRAHLAADLRITAELSAARAALVIDSAQLRADAQSFGWWGAYAKRIEAQRLAERDTASKTISAAEEFANVQSAQAYRLGRASCGSSHEAIQSPIPSAAPAGGLPDDDLAGIIQSAAFTPKH